MKQIEAIFFDVDGTLLSFNTGKIPDSAIKSLQLLKEKGIKIFIATGRAKAEMDIVNGLYFDGYITLNGQYCYDKENIKIFENALHKDDIQKLILYSTENDIPCYFVEENNAYYNMRNSLVDEVEKMIRLETQPIGNTESALTNSIYQVSAFVDTNKEKELLRLMPHSASARWYPTFCDLFPMNGSKIVGIHEVCKHYNININNTMAFGDAGNDLTMLKGVGLSVGMGNGSQEVKDIVDYVTDDVDNDGIYNALKHFNII